MKTKSNISGIDYETREVCRIVNPKQCLLYIKNGAYPIDVYTSVDKKTDQDVIVMIFKKSDTSDLYKKWCDYSLG